MWSFYIKWFQVWTRISVVDCCAWAWTVWENTLTLSTAFAWVYRQSLSLQICGDVKQVPNTVVQYWAWSQRIVSYRALATNIVHGMWIAHVHHRLWTCAVWSGHVHLKYSLDELRFERYICTFLKNVESGHFVRLNFLEKCANISLICRLQKNVLITLS